MDFEEWIDSYEDVSGWMQQYDIDEMMDQAQGFARITNFLPPKVAEGALAWLQTLPPSAWAPKKSADTDKDDVNHHFLITKAKAEDPLARVHRVLSLLLPGKLHNLSAAKYTHGHGISDHDDRAYQQVLMEDGNVVLASRDVAVIWYLTKDWDVSCGGLLVDLGSGEPGGTTIVPEFNSLIVFRVPRSHMVTPMTTDRNRFTVFGWFLEEGDIYAAYEATEGMGQDAAREARQKALEAQRTLIANVASLQPTAQVKRTKPKKRKKKKKKKLMGAQQTTEHISTKDVQRTDLVGDSDDQHLSNSTANLHSNTPKTVKTHKRGKKRRAAAVPQQVRNNDPTIRPVHVQAKKRKTNRRPKKRKLTKTNSVAYNVLALPAARLT